MLNQGHTLLALLPALVVMGMGMKAGTFGWRVLPRAWMLLSRNAVIALFGYGIPAWFFEKRINLPGEVAFVAQMDLAFITTLLQGDLGGAFGTLLAPFKAEPLGFCIGRYALAITIAAGTVFLALQGLAWMRTGQSRTATRAEPPRRLQAHQRAESQLQIPDGR